MECLGPTCWVRIEPSSAVVCVPVSAANPDEFIQSNDSRVPGVHGVSEHIVITPGSGVEWLLPPSGLQPATVPLGASFFPGRGVTPTMARRAERWTCAETPLAN